MNERLVTELAQAKYGISASIQGELADYLERVISDLNLREAKVTNLKERFHKKEEKRKEKYAERC